MRRACCRALKTKGNTPKYGLIFHSSFIGRAKQRNKVGERARASGCSGCGFAPVCTHLGSDGCVNVFNVCVRLRAHVCVCVYLRVCAYVRVYF